MQEPKDFITSRRTVVLEGMRDGVPIALAYLVVGFTLGIAAKNAGFTPWQGFLASFFNNASAGEYAAFTLAASDAPYWEMALMTLIANARYLLMSCVISQKFAPDAPFYHRVLVGFDLTDEIFGISVARRGSLDPWYNYGAMLVALPGWSGGTVLGILAGEALPPTALSALSVALYGMFIAIILPPAKFDRIVLGSILLSFAASFIASRLAPFSSLSGGTRIILLTLLIAGGAAALFPIREGERPS